MNQSEIILYKTEDGAVKIDTIFQNETIWLTQSAMAELFGVNVPAISKHLKNIFEEGELQKEATLSKMETVQNEGGRQITRNKDFYNLDAIIAVGYRVNSKRATQFRIWATAILKEYIIKGFAMDDERLKQSERWDYFDEWLDNSSSNTIFGFSGVAFCMDVLRSIQSGKSPCSLCILFPNCHLHRVFEQAQYCPLPTTQM